MIYGGLVFIEGGDLCFMFGGEDFFFFLYVVFIIIGSYFFMFRGLFDVGV